VHWQLTAFPGTGGTGGSGFERDKSMGLAMGFGKIARKLKVLPWEFIPKWFQIFLGDLHLTKVSAQSPDLWAVSLIFPESLVMKLGNSMGISAPCFKRMGWVYKTCFHGTLILENLHTMWGPQTIAKLVYNSNNYGLRY